MEEGNVPAGKLGIVDGKGNLQYIEAILGSSRIENHSEEKVD